MLEAALKGGLAGLAYGFLLGPLFFIGLRITLTKGFRHGLMLVLGAFCSDMILIVATWWGARYLSDVVQDGPFHTTLGTISALLVIGFGISAMLPGRSRRFQTQQETLESGEKRRMSVLKGFLLNMANPSNWIFWLSMNAAANSQILQAGTSAPAVIFLTSAIGVVCASDICKVILTYYIGRRITPEFIRTVVLASGILLMAVGIWMLLNIFTHIV
ncbi:MAG: LysE family transporter [Bacteroidetes bacterium]|nr:LysE family transporter [Bacteroidota bacterium]